MARTAAAAQVDGRVWSLLLEKRSCKSLREGGFFAGHNLKEDLKTELRRQFWEQELSQKGETLSHYLTAQPSANCSISTSSPVKDMKAAKRRRVSRDLASLQILDRGHDWTTSLLPVSHSTRSAQKKSKLVAAEKLRLATTARRRFLAAQKKRKLADEHKLFAVSMRKIVTRSSHN